MKRIRPGTTPHNPQAGTDPIPALSALYQGEKTDASAIFNTAMAMMGVAVAYLIGAIPFVRKLSDGPIPWLFLILLPGPLWLVVAFHSLITLNALSHGISVRIIEDELFEASGLRAKVARDMVGSAAADKIMDITQERLIHKLTTVFVYGGVGLLVCSFTWYSVYSAADLVGAPVIWTAAVIYSLIGMMVLLSWIVGVAMINKGRKESQTMGAVRQTRMRVNTRMKISAPLLRIWATFRLSPKMSSRHTTNTAPESPPAVNSR